VNVRSRSFVFAVFVRGSVDIHYLAFAGRVDDSLSDGSERLRARQSQARLLFARYRLSATMFKNGVGFVISLRAIWFGRLLGHRFNIDLRFGELRDFFINPLG